MKLIFNPTNKSMAVWWGHTPLYIASKQGVMAEDAIVDVVIKHNDYKDLQVFTGDQINAFRNEGGSFVRIEGQEQEIVRGQEEVLSIDPETASIDALRQYAIKNNLKIDADISESDLRSLVDEHMLG